jgi:hypothetical protein
MDQRGKPQALIKKNPTGGMDVCLLCCIRTVVWTISGMKDKNRIKQYNKWIKGEKPQELIKKKSHRGHGCLSVVSVVCCQVEVYATG